MTSCEWTIHSNPKSVTVSLAFSISKFTLEIVPSKVERNVEWKSGWWIINFIADYGIDSTV